MANKYQDIQLLWTNSLDTPPNPQDLKLGQPLINIRDGVETLYLKNEKGDGLIEFVGKNAIIDLINEIIDYYDIGGLNEKLAKKIQNVLGDNAIISTEDKDADGNKIIRLSLKVDESQLNKATITENGLFVSKITDCGTF